MAVTTLSNGPKHVALPRVLTIPLPDGFVPVAGRVEIVARNERDAAPHRSVVLVGYVTTDDLEGPELIEEDEWLGYLAPTTTRLSLLSEYLAPLQVNSGDH